MHDRARTQTVARVDLVVGFPLLVGRRWRRVHDPQLVSLVQAVAPLTSST